MWLLKLTEYLFKHRAQAIALTFLVTFIPVIGIIGILIAALVTLRKGVAEGAIFTFAATLPYAISFYVTGGHGAVVPLVVWAAVGVAVFSNLLTWVFAIMLLRGTTWSVILQLSALIGVLVISVIHLAYPDVASWWGVQLQAYYEQASSMTGFLKPPGDSLDMQLEAINVTKQYATGMMVAAVLFNALLQLIAARWWQSIVYMPGTLRKELHGIRLSQLAGGLFLLSLVFAYLGNGVVLDIMPVLYMLFGAAGLSLIHYLFGLMTSSTRWFWLCVLYVTIIFSLPMSMVFVAMFALLDIWLDVRKRVSKV
jgi:hypothetical protein